MRRICYAALIFAGMCMQASAQQADDKRPQPSASDGGEVRIIEPTPVDPADDPVNAFTERETVDGLVVTLTIDGDRVTLDNAVLARVPKSVVNRAVAQDAGDVVRVTGYIGDEAVAATAVPDTVLNASEGGGLVRTTRRQITAALAADRPLDRIEVVAGATDARAVLPVGAAYAPYCEAAPESQWCPKPRQ